MREETLKKYVKPVCPGGAADAEVFEHAGMPARDPAARIGFLSLTYPELAADAILHPYMIGELSRMFSEWTENIGTRVRGGRLGSHLTTNACRFLIETAFNLAGLESRRVGFAGAEINRGLLFIKEELHNLEITPQGKAVLEIVTAAIIYDMKRVMNGNSMVAKAAENIEARLDKDNLADSFISAAINEIRDNVYYKMTSRRMSKFGNDSATGLRWVRHLGFVQVSSNPVIAARAYEECPELWSKFKEIILANPEWRERPQDHEDEIALHATIVALLPNLLVFRPIALLSGFHDGLVSYQLNPLKAVSTKESLRDAQNICRILEQILRVYDAWLGWDKEKYNGRPNMVFKVPAYAPAAIATTAGLNRRGIGSNNTVTYSVSQELRLLIAEAEGMAMAVRRGIKPSQVYQTNMIGRTEDHLREAVAAALVDQLSDNEFDGLAGNLAPETQGTRVERTKTICAKKHLKSLTDAVFVKAIASLGQNMDEYLMGLELAVRSAGIYVTRRVYKLFFDQKNRVLWKRYLQNKFGISENQARLILNRIDMLPASKRRAGDTYLVLGGRNVTNTEFPNQQLVVWSKSRESGFHLARYGESINFEPNDFFLDQLLQIPDFVKIYELNPWLIRKLRSVGIAGDYGKRGMHMKNWSNYGAARKTMDEFTGAYTAFRQKAVEVAREVLSAT